MLRAGTIGREHGDADPGRAVPVAAADAALRGGLRGVRRRRRHGAGALPRLQRGHAALLRRIPLLPAQDAPPDIRATGGTYCTVVLNFSALVG